MRRIVRAAREIIRLTFARERLGEAQEVGSARQAPRPFLRMLVGMEPLPLDPPAPPRPPGTSLLRAALAPEALPLDPVVQAPRRRSRLAALFAPESLDDP